MTRGNPMTKLERLAEIEGFATVEAMLEASSVDSVVPAICINPECDYADQLEPDQTEGYCENCGTNTVQSCLVIAGII